MWQNSSLACSLGTRPFARGARKRLGTNLHLSCPQAGMLTWPIKIVGCKWRHGNDFQCCHWLDTTNRCATPYDTKVEGETTRLTVVMHTVLPQIANYPCLIAIHGDNSNIGPFLLPMWRVLFQYYWCEYQEPQSEVPSSPLKVTTPQPLQEVIRSKLNMWTPSQVRQEGQKGWRETGSSLSHNNNFVLIPMYAGLDLCLTNHNHSSRLSSPTRQGNIENGIGNSKWRLY